MIDRDDTICAPATAPGEGAIGIVRVSGKAAIRAVARHFAPSSGTALTDADSHTVHHGRFTDAAGNTLDEVLVILMRAPRSYTTEDVVEVQCHGGSAAVEAIMGCLLAAGLRMAEPGEFTRRAFLSGRIDLTRAESVLAVIRARTSAAHRIAQRQMAGALSAPVKEVADALVTLAAHMEAAIDFPEEDLESDVPKALLDHLYQARDGLSDISRKAQAGHLLTEGVRLAIVGRPNVGKSSLLNRLLGYERAIVAAQAGTTRDVVEAELAVDGIRFVVQDTAGIRHTREAVEAEGVRRSRVAATEADVTLIVLDGSVPVTAEDEALLSEFSGPSTVVASNKSDLTAAVQTDQASQAAQVIPVSALTGLGMDELKTALYAAAAGPSAQPLSHAFLVTSRQSHALKVAIDATSRAAAGLSRGHFAELIATDVREALDALGEISGETTTDDILDRIFSTFCIGK